VGLLVLYHVPWTSFYIGVVSTSQHLQQRFMEEMSMRHLFESGVLTLLLARLMGGVANSWCINCRKHVIGLKL